MVYGGPGHLKFQVVFRDPKFQGNYGFSDYPSRFRPPTPEPPNVNTKSWAADLVMSSWNGVLDANNNGTVTIDGGIHWGFWLQEYPAQGGAGIGGGGMNPSVAILGRSRCPSRVA